MSIGGFNIRILMLFFFVGKWFGVFVGFIGGREIRYEILKDFSSWSVNLDVSKVRIIILVVFFYVRKESLETFFVYIYLFEF